MCYHTKTSPEMLALTLPPPPPPPPLEPPPIRAQIQPSPLSRIFLSKQAMNQYTLAQHSTKVKGKDQPILQPARRTNPVIWCGAVLCIIFSLLLIIFGIATLIIFLSIKPRKPVFDTPGAGLNVIYFDAPGYFNGDLTFMANISNPNQKLDARFEYVNIGLYFSDNLIAAQALQPFTLRRGQTRLESIRFISSLVYLPPNPALGLQRQVQRNRINYNIIATFRVRVTLGLMHFSYWLHGRCQLEMSSPPTGVLISRRCITKR